MSVLFTYDEIDEMVCEFGAPEYRQTDDGEGYYWQFSGTERPVADTLAELLLAGRLAYCSKVRPDRLYRAQ